MGAWAVLKLVVSVLTMLLETINKIVNPPAGVRVVGEDEAVNEALAKVQESLDNLSEVAQRS